MKLKLNFSTRLCATLTAVLMATCMVRADVIILHSGEKYEGKVLSETDTTVVIEYNLTPKIKDKRELKKSDIKSMTRLTPAEMEIAELQLRTLVPTPDLMSAADYERIIQDKLRTFAAKHPGTPEAKDVEDMIKTLTEEKAKVMAGQIKMEGKWLDPETVKLQEYNIEAYRARVAMNEAVKGTSDGRFREALRLFDRLQTSYPASQQFVQAIPEALAIMEDYAKQLSGMAAEQPVLQKQREEGLKVLSGADLQVTRNSIEQEQRDFKSTLDAQAKQKVKWRDVYKYDLKSIQAALDVVAKESVTLKTIDPVALREENEALGEVIVLLTQGKAEEANTALEPIRDKRTTLFNKTELARLEKELRVLRDKLKARQASAPEVAAAPTPGAPKAGEGPSANAIDEAMRKRELEKKGKGAAADAKPGDAKPAPGKPGDDKKGADAKKPDGKGPAKPASDSGSTPPQEDSMLTMINDYIPFIGGGLLLILILAMVLGKKKKAE